MVCESNSNFHDIPSIRWSWDQSQMTPRQVFSILWLLHVWWAFYFVRYIHPVATFRKSQDHFTTSKRLPLVPVTRQYIRCNDPLSGLLNWSFGTTKRNNKFWKYFAVQLRIFFYFPQQNLKRIVNGMHWYSKIFFTPHHVGHFGLMCPNVVPSWSKHRGVQVW